MILNSIKCINRVGLFGWLVTSFVRWVFCAAQFSIAMTFHGNCLWQHIAKEQLGKRMQKGKGLVEFSIHTLCCYVVLLLLKHNCYS